MSSHLLNYRFSPDQSDIQYSPPSPVSAETRWWTCEQHGSAWLPRLLKALQPSQPPRRGTSTHHLPFSLLLAPPALFNGKSECGGREIVPAVRGRREGEGEDGGTILPLPLGSSQPLPTGGKLSWWSQICSWSSSQWFCWQVSAGWLSLAMAAEVLCWCLRDTQRSPSVLLLVRVCLRLAVISSDL